MHLMGVTCVQGMAFGSPVVPDENRILIRSVGLAGWLMRQFYVGHQLHPRPGHPVRKDDPSPPTTIARGALASRHTFVQRDDLSPRVYAATQQTPDASAIWSRRSISAAAKLSAIETTGQPAYTAAR